MKILSFLISRSIYSILLIIAVVVLNFLLLYLAPGNIVDTLAGEMGAITDSLRVQLEQAYGLDQPMIVQLGNYLTKAMQGDLGYSFYMNESVTKVLWDRFPATALLFVLSLMLSVIIGTIMGSIAALKPEGVFSAITITFALAAYSTPVFWIGIMLLLCFSIWIPIFPVSGMLSMDLIIMGGTFMDYVLDIAAHLILPLITLSLIYVASYARLARASMIEVLKADYVRTARAKGLAERVIIFKHALRNAILPVITATGMRLGQVFSGAVIVETVFSWPGLGHLAFESVIRRDYPVVLGVLIFSTIIVIIANILTDLTYRLVDPRINAN